jgi:hypothetical protein
LQQGAAFSPLKRYFRKNQPKAGIEVLVEYDWLTVEKEQTGGRQTERIRLNPGINSDGHLMDGTVKTVRRAFGGFAVPWYRNQITFRISPESMIITSLSGLVFVSRLFSPVRGVRM